jgi:hypothetical protein
MRMRVALMWRGPGEGERRLPPPKVTPDEKPASRTDAALSGLGQQNLRMDSPIDTADL